jgi:hypothetical protein
MKGIYNKFIIGLIVVLLGTVSSCSAAKEQPSGEAAWVRGYHSLNELSTDPDIDMIAIGTIDRVVEIFNYSPIPEHVDYGTKFAFRVETVLKGEYIKEIIVTQVGAPDKPGSDIGEDPLFRIGEKYVLFLSKVIYPDIYHPTREVLYPNTYNHPGPWGRYLIIDNKAYSLNYTSTGTYHAPAGLDFNGVDLSTFTQEINSILRSQ